MSAPRSEFPGNSPAGDAYSEGSSRRIAAHLHRPVGGPVVHLLASASGERLAQARVSDVRRSSRLGSLPSEVAFPGGWRFLSEDHQGIDELLGNLHANRLHRLEAFRPRLALVVVAVLLGAFAVWRWGLGLVVALALAITPAELPDIIDGGYVRIMDHTITAPSGLGDGEKRKVREVFEQLLGHAPRPPYGDYTLHFRSMPGLGPNALALPGGTIIVSDRLVEEFPDDDVQAGVLGHEISHVAERHGLQQLYRSVGLFALIGLLVGDVGPVLEDMLLEGGVLLSLSYSRAQEAEADRLGAGLAAKAGFDQDGLARFLDGLGPDDDASVPAWLSTHPATEERIRHLRSRSYDILESAR